MRQQINHASRQKRPCSKAQGLRKRDARLLLLLFKQLFIPLLFLFVHQGLLTQYNQGISAWKGQTPLLDVAQLWQKKTKENFALSSSSAPTSTPYDTSSLANAKSGRSSCGCSFSPSSALLDQGKSGMCFLLPAPLGEAVFDQAQADDAKERHDEGRDQREGHLSPKSACQLPVLDIGIGVKGDQGNGPGAKPCRQAVIGVSHPLVGHLVAHDAHEVDQLDAPSPHGGFGGVDAELPPDQFKGLPQNAPVGGQRHGRPLEDEGFAGLDLQRAGQYPEEQDRASYQQERER